MKILVSWSSGKDAAWVLHRLQAQHPGAAAALLSTTNEAVDRVAMHGVRRTVLEAQAAASGLPLTIVPLPWPCSNNEYEARMATAMATKVREGFTHVAFGDLFLEDVRRYREEKLTGTGLTPLFPLWREGSTRALAHEMMAGGVKATLACVDTRVLPVEFAGRSFDAGLLADLPADVDPCGENGEFHTCVWDGPMFAHPLALEIGATVIRDQFAFCDLILSAAPRPVLTPR